jgi:hypothetical protein
MTVKNDIDLPKDYKPFPKIIICGNTLINVQIPFEVYGDIPLLIGDGNSPKIWLKAMTSRQERKFREIVRANRALQASVTVSGAGTYDISVTVPNMTIIRLHRNTEGIPEVTKLDLRPIGLSIQGDSEKLAIGSQLLTENTFENVRTMVGIR